MSPYFSNSLPVSTTWVPEPTIKNDFPLISYKWGHWKTPAETESCSVSHSEYNTALHGVTAGERRQSWLAVNCLNPTVFLLQLENYIQDSMKQDMVQIQQTAVHNHTATMIEIGTNLLSQTAEQTRKLTNVEAQVRQCLQLLCNAAMYCKAEHVKLSERLHLHLQEMWLFNITACSDIHCIK